MPCQIVSEKLSGVFYRDRALDHEVRSHEKILDRTACCCSAGAGWFWGKDRFRVPEKAQGLYKLTKIEKKIWLTPYQPRVN